MENGPEAGTASGPFCCPANVDRLEPDPESDTVLETADVNLAAVDD